MNWIGQVVVAGVVFASFPSYKQKPNEVVVVWLFSVEWTLRQSTKPTHWRAMCAQLTRETDRRDGGVVRESVGKVFGSIRPDVVPCKQQDSVHTRESEHAHVTA